ncbi:DUF4974 domain-containing protein [Danxiaibacter flavus]|uniref:DUF4974 domain-containing protein n=1 Tax=Danxiaibacter flavus TaxID=3049108 RepID=A0ABV3ZMD6_9BACT|nr:DUF4974 domain-containing protein [Chitinophagaceae bacterium DXS]
MNPQQAKELLEKYRLGLCTEEEKNAIEDWFNSLNEEGSWQWSEDERNVFKEQLKKRIDKEITDEQQTPVSRMRSNRFLKYVAAASLLAVIATGAYFLFNRSDKEKEKTIAATTQSYKNDVKPGTDGAILTLADGRQVMLDSSGNTVPVQDGNVQLTNKDGKLTYSVNGEQQANEVLSYNTVQTPRARQFKLHLSDGTNVWLNAASSIRYPVVFGKKERVVEITGEVYFEVAKLVDETNKQPVPFTVHIQKASGDAGEVQVLGTHFNINAYDDEDDIKTTLVEGKVKVKKQQEEVFLLPGNQAKMDKKGKFTVVKDADITNVMAWKNGLFSFDNAGVQVVMNQLARWYDIEVEYAGGKVPNDRFWGDIQRNARLSTVLKMLEISGVKFTLEGNKVTVLK